MCPSCKVSGSGISRTVQGRKLRRSLWGDLAHGNALKGLLENHVVLPCQFNEARLRHPAQILYLTLLLDAALAITKGRDLLSVRRWLDPDSPYKAAVSFDLCCELVGVDPDYVRPRFLRAMNTVEVRLQQGIERRIDRRCRTTGTGTAALRHPSARTGGRYRNTGTG